MFVRNLAQRKIPDPPDTSRLMDVADFIGIARPSGAQPGKTGWPLTESRRVSDVLRARANNYAGAVHPYMYCVDDLYAYKAEHYEQMLDAKVAVASWNAVIDACLEPHNTPAHILEAIAQSDGLLCGQVGGAVAATSAFARLTGTFKKKHAELLKLKETLEYMDNSGPYPAEQCELVNAKHVVAHECKRRLAEAIAAAEANKDTTLDIYMSGIYRALCWAEYCKPDAAQTAWLETWRDAVKRHHSGADPIAVQTTVNKEFAEINI
jgi:hypothetical protein